MTGPMASPGSGLGGGLGGGRGRGPGRGTGRNLDGVRRGNLATVLGLVHRAGAASRSEITALTGLNRSTVAALVAELVALELVVENNPETTNRVGRPSPVVSPHPAPVAIAVNPELDAITVGIVGLGARVVRRVRREVEHPLTPEQTARLIVDITDELAEDLTGHRVIGIGLAIPGLVRADGGLVRWAPHLGWTDAPIVDLVARATGFPVRAGNDAGLGATAEHLFGAGRGIDELIYLNGGASGIGGGVIVGGEPFGGRGGYAGEFGQNRPAFSDPADQRSPNGTLEDEVSRARLLAALRLVGGDEASLERAVLRSKSGEVHRELARQRRVLGMALSSAVNVLNPELIVLGGFLASVYTSDAADFEAAVAEHSIPAAWEGTSIRIAGLGPDRLLIGAAELAFAGLLGDPAG